MLILFMQKLQENKNRMSSATILNGTLRIKVIKACLYLTESPPPAAARRPMTKEEWEKQQSVIRRVYDPETGRNR